MHKLLILIFAILLILPSSLSRRNRTDNATNDTFQDIDVDNSTKPWKKNKTDPKNDTVMVDSQDFVFGFLQGVYKRYYEIDTCMKPNEIKDLLQDAIINLDKSDFDHIRTGIFYLGKTIDEIHDAIALCPNMANELDEIQRMAKMFKFPASIVYVPHKQLIINSIDVFPFIYVFYKFYNRQSFTSGQNLGIGADMVFRNNEVFKSEDLVNQYEFLAGFMSVGINNYGIDNQDLYNHMGDSIDNSIIDQLNKAFTNPDDLARVWVGVNDLAQIFLDSLDQFVVLESMTADSRDKLKAKGVCLSQVSEDMINDDLSQLYMQAVEEQKTGDLYEAGRLVGIMTKTLCPDQEVKQKKRWFWNGDYLTKFLQNN